MTRKERSMTRFKENVRERVEESEKSTWQTFCEVTYMHGFSYSIYEKHSKVERTMWLITTLCFVGMAAFFVVEPIKACIDRKTETVLHAVNTADRHEVEPYSYIIYCFDDMLNQSALADAGISTDLALYALSLVNNLDAGVLDNFYADANIVDRKLSITNELTPAFAASVDTTDLAQQFLQLTNDASYDSVMDFFKEYTNQFYVVPAEFNRFFMRYGMPCYEMWKSSTEESDVQMTATANQIVYKFYHPIKATSTKVRISPQRGTVQLAAEEQYNIDYSTGAFDTEFEVSPAATTLNGNTILKKFSTSITKFQRINRGDCNEAENVGLSTIYECKTECCRKVAEDAVTQEDGTLACHLITDLSKSLSKTSPTCNLHMASQLVGKDIMQIVNDSAKNCTYACLEAKSCTELAFHMAESNRLPLEFKKLNLALPADTIRVMIEHDLTSAAVYEERYKYSFGDMMSTVGGTMGLFIGASLIALFHAFLMSLKSIAHYSCMLFQKSTK